MADEIYNPPPLTTPQWYTEIRQLLAEVDAQIKDDNVDITKEPVLVRIPYTNLRFLLAGFDRLSTVTTRCIAAANGFSEDMNKINDGLEG
jgi:hypothetical protein